MRRKSLTLLWQSVLGSCLLVMLPFGNLASAKTYTVENVSVVRILDGDTAVLSLPGQGNQTIRTWGIDCPEKKQRFGYKSEEFYASLIWGKPLTLKVRSKDQYGRLVAQIYYEGADIGLTMVRYGFAWHYVSITKDKALAKAQADAKKQELGLWQEKNPTPPWVFRKTPKAQ